MEASTLLEFSEWLADTIEADPRCTEEELVELVRVDELGILPCHELCPLGLHQRSEQWSELYKPSTDVRSQQDRVIKLRLVDRGCFHLVRPPEVVDEAVLDRSMAVTEPLQLG